jgi:hypothetical protein
MTLWIIECAAITVCCQPLPYFELVLCQLAYSRATVLPQWLKGATCEESYHAKCFG